ncbi:MAG: CBS domain-containing protein [Winogradskyella sp.]|jgi:CBS domain-containing protein|nr:CBS domain-containing protein [Winogradskyella sp.]
MKHQLPITKIMTKDVITLDCNDNLETAEILFKRNNIRHIPVVKNKSIIGMLSYTDLLRISFADATDEYDDDVETVVYNMFTIEQVMAKNVISVQSSATIKEVAKLLGKKEFHALPVIDQDKLIGIVTSTNLINYLVEKL